MAPTNTFLSSLSFLPLLRVLGKFSVLSSALFALNSQSNWFSNTGQVSFELPDGSTWNPIELSHDSSQSQDTSFQVVIPKFLSRKSPTLDSFWKSTWELLVVAHSSASMESPSVLSPHLLSSTVQSFYQSPDYTLETAGDYWPESNWVQLKNQTELGMEPGPV